MAAFTRGRRVLLVGGEGVVLYAPSAGGVERETSISWEVPNFEEVLSEALAAKNQSKSVLILFDGADQTYRKEENIPKLSPIDRPRFVKRKLELAFPSYPIRASMELKPQKKRRGVTAIAKTAKEMAGGRSYLFVALPETEQLDRIGVALLESGVPVAGFGLLPMESAALVTELSEKAFADNPKKSRWAVLVGQHETGGLRQVVVKDGNLALTRLTPPGEGGLSGPGWVEDVVREFRATLTYISRFGYSPDDGLDVMIICGEIERQFFDQRALGITNFKCLNVGEALRAIGVRSFGMEKINYADPLHATWLGRKASLKLPVRVPSIHRVMAPRLGVRIASTILVLGALVLAGLSVKTYLEYTSVQENIAGQETLKSMRQREYAEESKVFEALPMKPAVVKAAMSVKALLERNTVKPSPYLQRIKSVIGNEIQLEDLSYVYTPGPALVPTTGARSLFAPPADPEDRGRIRIAFKFGLPNSMSLEQKVQRADQMLARFREIFPGFNVRIVTQFGRVSPDGMMQGNIADTTAAPVSTVIDLAEFEIEGVPL